MTIQNEDDVTIDMFAAQQAMDADFGGEEASQDDDIFTASPAPAPAAAPAPAPAPEAWRSPPKSWKGDYHPHYEKLDPQVMQYIHEREKQALDGLMQYKSAYDPYAALERQHKAFLEQNKVSMPVVADRMLQAHIALTQGQPEMKQQYIQQLIQEYGLEDAVRALFGTAQQSGQQDLTRSVMPLLRQQLEPLQRTIQQIQDREAQKGLEMAQGEVDKFFANPENEYAKELESDMIQLIEKGLATSLSDAYEKAIWINPAVKAKALQKEIDKVAKPQKVGPKNVRSGSTPPASTKPPGDEDMDATMRNILRDINNR